MSHKIGDKVLLMATIACNDNIGNRPYMIETKQGTRVWVSAGDFEADAKTYTQGLADAWELAKKIVCHEEQGGMPVSCFGAIFNEYMTVEEVLASITYEEALAKIEAYEKGKKIKVGSIAVVKGETSKGIVTGIFSNGVAFLMWGDGSCSDFELSELDSTGETVEGLDSLLRQIGE